MLASSLDIKTIDFSAPWTETPCLFLIPFPTSSENIAAIVKPFDLTVGLILNDYRCCDLFDIF